MSRPKILVFASGNRLKGGSGFQELVENSRSGVLDAEIVGVVTNHENGGVRQRASRLGIKSYLMSPPFSREQYGQVLCNFQSAEWFVLSGWLKMVRGLDSQRTFNIHPGPLPRFGGKGMYGHHVHEAVIAAYRRGQVTVSAVCMHFVTGEYDRGPIFFSYPVIIRPDDTPESLAGRVNKIEHSWQSYVTNLVVHGLIGWDGIRSESMVVPFDWPFLPVTL